MASPFIILDFDGTITHQDTINFIAQSVVSHHKGNSASINTKGGGAQEAWDHILAAYLADYEHHSSNYRPVSAARTTLEQELAFQESLRSVDQASLDRVVASGLFRGITADDLRRAGEEAVRNGRVTIRKGFEAFIGASRNRWELGVLSVNWSKGWVEGVLGGYGEEALVVVNEIVHPEGGVKGPQQSGGRVIMTARDKLEAMRAMRMDLTGGERRLVIYVGDTTTDLACLLDADLGVVVADEDGAKSGGLLDTLRRIGYEVPHIPECCEQGGSAKRKLLVWARDFDEILHSNILERELAKEG
ncbi:hypothetical protein B0H63DRAFT_457644 [Podospora didyma]|uniref:Uncharacterized protein n=1 Tax=Podospora didyma TaxID=330526 RepID=A0AAE0U7D8_9PEZI|nr:hypothetical protein B0H63DRAFT_457644 [Podospora didyma]